VLSLLYMGWLMAWDSLDLDLPSYIPILPDMSTQRTQQLAPSVEARKRKSKSWS